MATVIETHWSGKAIHKAFTVLFFVTPLLFLPVNYELFEYNKMMFVYLMTSVITALWLGRVLIEKKLVLRRTPLDIPILIYVAANIITTVTSIDQHTSIFGYYSRFNGGLLSTIAYSLLFFAFTNNIVQKESVFKYLKTITITTAFISAYAILERLGIDKNYWVQDVQARVFSTFGQPNWLAAYLAMVMPINIALFLTAETRKTKVVHLLAFSINYIAFTFTYSRGGTLGLLAGLTVFFLLYLATPRVRSIADLRIQPSIRVVVIMFFCFVLFGNALLRDSTFNGLLRRPVQSQQFGTQLDTPGTESSQIRLIVWQGAWDIFRNNPIFGTGVETFAYSYYQYRPAAHNQTTEWDFLYNKAHNEYLNELATKGLAGFIPYLILIGSFLGVAIRQLINFPNSKFQIPFNFKLSIFNWKLIGNWQLATGKSKNHIDPPTQIVTIALLAAIISYLVQNVFGFSVVAITLLFYMFPACTAVLYPTVIRAKEIRWVGNLLQQTIPRYVLYCVGILVALYCLTSLVRFWIADYYYAKGYNAANNGHAAEAYATLANASFFNPSEPLYTAYLGYVSAQLAQLAHEEKESELYTQFLEEAEKYTKRALATSPRNTTVLRTATKTYTQLALLDEQFTDKSLRLANSVVVYSPTEPHDRLRLAQILSYVEKNNDARREFLYTIDLKPDYADARISYAKFLYTIAQKEDDPLDKTVLGEAIETLKLATTSTEAQALIASYSAKLGD